MSGNYPSAAITTRRRLLNSFNSLLLRGAKNRITVTDIVREAGVGRSTFYDHYSSADDIHQQALAGPMALLAESILGLQTEERLSYLLTHFWENRERARQTLSGEEGDTVERLLISILESRLSNGAGSSDKTRKVAAIEFAVVPLALITSVAASTQEKLGVSDATPLDGDEVIRDGLLADPQSGITPECIVKLHQVTRPDPFV